MTKQILFILISFIFSSNAISQVAVGDKAPSLSVDEWLKGEPVKEYNTGTVYLVEFWGTWCGPCIQNIPHLSELQKKHSGDGLVVIGVATHEFDGREKLDKFMKDRGDEMEYTVAYDTDLSMEREWDTGPGKDESSFRLPVCFLIDRDGKVVFVGHPGDDSLEGIIESAVRK